MEYNTVELLKLLTGKHNMGFIKFHCFIIKSIKKGRIITFLHK